MNDTDKFLFKRKKKQNKFHESVQFVLYIRMSITIQRLNTKVDHDENNVDSVTNNNLNCLDLHWIGRIYLESDKELRKICKTIENFTV